MAYDYVDELGEWLGKCVNGEEGRGREGEVMGGTKSEIQNEWSCMKKNHWWLKEINLEVTEC